MPGPPSSPLSAPPAERVFVERFAEPITGWAMAGAGAEWDASHNSPLQVELHYDGHLRVTDAVAVTPTGYRFGIQAPIEPVAKRLTVVLRGNGREAVLFDGEFTALPDRAAVVLKVKPVPRWLSPAMTLGRGVARGKVFGTDWWAARARRYRELAIKARQRVRDKLLVRAGYRARFPHDAYVERTTFTRPDLDRMAGQAARFRYRPTFSILCPVYNVDPRWLGAAVESVRNQVYPQWELCLSDDASTLPATRDFLDRLPKDPRIKLVRRPVNGHICANTNSAAELATGEFVALLDNDDALAPHALFAVANLLQAHADADLIYSDEDKIDPAERRFDPQFKPDWSPDLLWSYNYVNHFTVIRRSVFEKAGRFRVGFEGSQDHDLLLRVTELTDRVHHIPDVLYHWRALPTSTAATASMKTYVHTSGQKAVGEALARRGIAASTYVPPFAEKLGLPVLGFDGRDDGPSVAVIIRGPAEDAARTARAVKQTTSYRNITVYLVLDSAPPADALNRIAAGRTEDFLLFLESGIEPTEPRWLSRLVATLAMPGIGAVGGLIRDADGAIVSAGTVLGLDDGTTPGDAYGGQKPDPVSYYFYAEVSRTVTAPARGCLLTTRGTFERVGGFDADRFAQTLFDVDYCLRLNGQGLRSVHVGGAELRWEGAHAGRHDAPTEVRTLRAAHGTDPDPYYNQNLSTWDSFTPRSDAPHLIAVTPTGPVPVLFATHNLTAFEGAPKIIRDVAVVLAGRGKVTATVFAPSPGKGAAAYESAGIPVFAEETAFAQRFIDGQWTPAEYEDAQAQLADMIHRARPRVVVANTLGMFPLVEAAARAGVPAILAIQESYPEPLFAQLFSSYGRWRCERAFLFADRIVFASRSCADLYRRLDFRKNFEVIHNGLDPRPFDEYQRRVTKAGAAATLPGSTGDRLRVVTVGTVCERKAQHVLVEAAAEIAKTRRDFTCYLVGAREGLPYLSYVRNLIRARGLDDIVVPVTETDDVWAFLRAADVFVCTSHVEAFSLSVLEAGAFGLPIVSTPCGGLDEQVVWGRSALRFDFDDSGQLAKQVARLFSDPGLCQEMAAESRAAFDLRLTADGMIERYGRVILAAARAKGIRFVPRRW